MGVQTEKAPRQASSKRSAAPNLVGTASESAPLAESAPNSIVARTSFIDPEQRCARIAEAAYYRAEHRGFESGYEVEDWLAAESEIDGELTLSETPPVTGP